MNRLARVIAKHEFRANLGRRGYIISTALVPALAVIGLVILVIVQTAQSDRPDADATTVGYVDHSGLLEGAHTVDGFAFEPFGEESAAIQALTNDEIDRLVEVPRNYLETGSIIEIEEQQRGIPGFEQEAPPIDGLLVDSLLEGVVTPDVLERVRTPAQVTVLSVDEAGNPVQEPFEGGRLLFFLVAAGLVLFATMMTAGYFQEGLSEEKENRIIEVLLSSATARDLMIGKFVALGGLGLAQLATWIASLVVLIGAVRITGVAELPELLAELSIPPAGDLVAAVVFFLLGYAFLGSLMGALGAIATSHREAQQVAFMLILPYFVPVWLLTSILQEPAGSTARILSLIPFTAPITGMIRLGFDAIEGTALFLSLGVMAVSVAAAFFFTMRVFELSLLMTGQRPRAGQIARAVVRGSA